MSGKIKGALVLGTCLLALALTPLGLGQIAAAAPTDVHNLTTFASGTRPTGTAVGALQPPDPAPGQDVQGLNLRPCTLITAQEASDLLETGVQAPQEANQACIYKSTPGGRYSVSVSAAQGLETQGILDNQLLLAQDSGANIDQTELEYLQSLEQNQYFTRYFEEFVAATHGVPNMQARLVKNNEKGYWAWFTSPGHVQGVLVMARGDKLIEINLVVDEANDEHAILEAATAQADLVFQRLPLSFVLPPSIE